MILTAEAVGPEHAITVADLADRVQISGRALRDVVRDLELAKRVLTNFSDGYYVCVTPDQATSATRRLVSQVQNMQARIDARRTMTAELARRQAS